MSRSTMCRAAIARIGSTRKKGDQTPQSARRVPKGRLGQVMVAQEVASELLWCS